MYSACVLSCVRTCVMCRPNLVLVVVVDRKQLHIGVSMFYTYIRMCVHTLYVRTYICTYNVQCTYSGTCLIQHSPKPVKVLWHQPLIYHTNWPLWSSNLLIQHCFPFPMGARFCRFYCTYMRMYLSTYIHCTYIVGRLKVCSTYVHM